MRMQELARSRVPHGREQDHYQALPNVRQPEAQKLLARTGDFLQKVNSILEPETASDISPLEVSESSRIPDFEVYSGKRHLSSVDSHDLEEIQILQNVWNRALGRRSNSPGQFDNYNPVLARWGYERLQTNRQRELFREYEHQNVTTALRERNHTRESRLTLTIGEDGKLHNEVFPDSSYKEVLERGRLYREKHGSQETVREQSEIEGFLKIQEALTSDDARAGTKFFVISPPGLVEGTPYMFNFIDSYELVEDEGGRAVRYTRYASPIGYDKYQEIVEGLSPGYFDQQDRPIDAWYLSNPILIQEAEGYKSADAVFAENFAEDVKAMEEKDFQELYKVYLPYILYYLDQLTADEFDPVKIAKAYNALLLSTEDQDMQKASGAMDIFVAPTAGKLSMNESQRIAEIVLRFGKKEVRQVLVGCGRSGGFGFDSDDPTANSVAQFDRYGSRTFTCPSCNKQNLRPEGGFVNSCQHCGSVLFALVPSDETAKIEKKDVRASRKADFAQAA